MIYRNIISLAAFVILSLGLTGCTETIRMKNQATGEVAECGDHPLLLPIYAMVAQGHDHQCVQDYKDQGFVRAAAE